MPLTDSFERYLSALKNTPAHEQTEMTSRGALEALLNEAGRQFGSEGVIVIHEPRRAQEKGAPDFKIVSNGMTLGYVENKAIGENLAKVAKSDQIKKYLTLSPNILLTDYLNWLWITPNGVQEARLATPSELEGKSVHLRPERAHELSALLRGFFSQPPQRIGAAKALAEALATRSQLLRDFLGEELARQEEAKAGGVLMGLYTAFKQQVSHEITIKEFADAFAQTLAYGLFLAKLNAKPTDIITLLNAKQHIPASFGLIQELVGFLDRLDQPQYADIRWVVEEVLSIINDLDLPAIHEDLAFRNRKGRRGSDARSEEEWRLFSRDPFIYFYEDYLAKYDAKMRKGRGVYYTPPPIVNFIVRAINDILKNSFGIEDGLADRKRVAVLDFATGTGTFLVEVLECIFEEIGGAESSKAQLIVREHILKNIYGFEFLVAPYTIAHLKLSQYLRDKEVSSGRKYGEFGPGEGERFQVFLTNTLEPIEPQSNHFLPELTKETEAAQNVKDQPILVITGNPPYSGHSRNPSSRLVPLQDLSADIIRRGGYKTRTIQTPGGPVKMAEMPTPIGEGIEEYRRGFPELSKPGQGKWLQDDYVKFIRFAQMKIDEEEQGVVGIITNHSFLDNPTFKGMRASLLRSFDQLYFIDLHGNRKKNERAPDGSDDENVFDIEQGVAISILVKKPGLPKGVWRADWWGSRQAKYNRAAHELFSPALFEQVEVVEPLRLFTNRDVAAERDYTKFWSVPEIFGRNRDPAPGIVTTHDEFAISFTKEEAVEKVEQLLSTATEDEARRLYRLCAQSQWSYERAKTELPKVDLNGAALPILYRPFDMRWTIWNVNVAVHRRERVNQHLTRPNIGLAVSKQSAVIGMPTFEAVMAVDTPLDYNSFRRGGQFIFPLYLYRGERSQEPEQGKFDIDQDPFDGADRIENIAPEFRRWIDELYGFSPSPEQVFGYVYAVLHAPFYRTAYSDFLRTDFPRVPFPETRDAFETLSARGLELAEIQLMRRAPPGGAKLGRYAGRGDNEVDKPRWSEVEEKLWINSTQGFAPVPREVWEFTIGGYQVLDKYLKSRKGRALSLDEIENVEKVTNILAFTLDQMGRIDEAYRAASEDGDDIHSDPEIMGGEHVFRGTRVPVRAIAEMMEEGADADEMLEGYPALNRSRLDRARHWAKENPSTPQPPVPPNFEPKVISRRRVPRRTRRDGGGAEGKARA